MHDYAHTEMARQRQTDLLVEARRAFLAKQLSGRPKAPASEDRGGFLAGFRAACARLVPAAARGRSPGGAVAEPSVSPLRAGSVLEA